MAVALAVFPVPTSAQEPLDTALGFLRVQVQATLKLKLPESSTASAERDLERLLSTLLTPAAASQIALYENPSLRALYAGLPAAAPPEGDPEAAPSPGNRHLHAADLQFLLSKASDAAETYEAFELILNVSADAERAFYRAVATRQLLDLMSRIEEAVSISAELRRLQSRTGAATTLTVAEAELYEAELSLRTAKARLDADKSRRALIKILGLPPATDLQLPDRLPDLPNALTVAAPEQISNDRPDLLASRWGEVAEKIQNRLEARTASDGTQPEKRSLASESPEGGIEFEVREAYANYRSTFEVASVMTDRIVPLSRVITDERLLEYNGMLIDVTDLVAAARDALSREMEAVTAQRDFFVARTDFQAAMAGSLPRTVEAEESSSVDAKEAAREH